MNTQKPIAYTPPHLIDNILVSRAALEGERKQVTVMFCDLANSTALAERLGPENMHALLNQFFTLALQEVHRYQGTINQFLGDGFMALFGAPVAYEDHARRAVLASLAIQRVLKESGVGTGLPPGDELSVRMGLNTGLVVVGSIGDNLRMDYTAVGDTTNVAARLQKLAQPGSILVSESTVRLLGGEVYIERLGPVRLKGKRHPVTPYRLVGYRPRHSVAARLGDRVQSQFVGRKHELAVLHKALDQVERGHGQVVCLEGDVGTGKSRLLYEFRQTLSARPITYLEGRCLSYSNSTPYMPVRDILRYSLGIVDTDSPQTIIAKVRSGLQTRDIDPNESAPYVLHLMGVENDTDGPTMGSPEERRARTFATIHRLCLRTSRRQPLILEVEDLHWIDQTSEDYIASLAACLADMSILLMTSYRPGYHPPWLHAAHTTHIVLHQLAPEESRRLVHGVLKKKVLPKPRLGAILDRAEGNPFFLEELTRAVIEQEGEVTHVAVPDTIQGVIMARIDRLPDSLKRLSQTASVLGRTFSVPLLKAIWETPEPLMPILQQLTQLEFLYERRGAGEPIYGFKHVLTQEVAYASLLTTRRQLLHAAAGQALEVLYAERLEEVDDRLAYHYGNV